jgi:hypothetical protein
MSTPLVRLFFAAGLAAAALTADLGPAHAAPRKAHATASIRSVAEVVAVDAATRTLSLKRDDGNTLTVVAGPRVKNFAQIRVGDFVIAEYGRAQAISLKTTAGTNDATDGAGPQPSVPKATPGHPRRRHVIADVIAIDDKKGLATMKMAKDQVLDLHVRDAKALAAVRIGDVVELEYTEAVATAVSPAKSRK